MRPTPWMLQGAIVGGDIFDKFRIFAEDLALPAQMPSRHARGLPPAKRLMLAILLDALACIKQDHSLSCRRAAYSARCERCEVEWWLAHPDKRYLYSVQTICDALGYDMEAYLRGMQYAARPTAPAPRRRCAYVPARERDAEGRPLG